VGGASTQSHDFLRNLSDYFRRFGVTRQIALIRSPFTNLIIVMWAEKTGVDLNLPFAAADGSRFSLRLFPFRRLKPAATTLPIHKIWPSRLPRTHAVADTPDRSPRPFDAKMVEHLVGLMGEHNLSEIDLHEGEHRIRLRRGSGQPTALMPVPIAAPAAEPPPAVAAKASALHEIKSPMVGTFYSKPAPDKADYVKAGSKVKPDSIVCKLEAMKLFNDLAAECTGTIVEICAKNGQAVDFGTVLFRVEVG
jgi:acetyl-CoA carboxylase biotin carboxyl carrier protein